MKNRGFSLVELLLTLTILSIVMTYGYASFSDARVTIEAEIDRQFILKIPVLLEQFYADKLSYPDRLDEIIASNNSGIYTPKSYYLLTYKRHSGNNYRLTATLNPKKHNSDKVVCAVININETGKLTGFDTAGNTISNLCWN